ncbi:MAG: SPOR domain-containing protein [Candidatus Marinimicrobia bacterium]|nr:SPOR domain-containing protein [Candidatus Neomarinimicrobiota bacterium]MCF7850164.1 SPOR domain-containing protein [Candidatus Neomarinimicrobiota bacterium]MCF7905147.1 SPOR domain-containing protein [Candidatus Neomarinimicrobiota bacterium]
MKRISAALILVLLLPLSIISQDVDGLLDLIESGKIDSATSIISELSYTYPGNPGVRYARALIQQDALVAAGLYKDIVRNHPNSPYVAGSIMHLGEYYYATGLYIQSRTLLARLVREYPDYPEILNAGNLLLRAGLAARQMDRVYEDLETLLQEYPQYSFDIPTELDLTRVRGRSQPAPVQASPTPAPLRSLGSDVQTNDNLSRAAFTLQAGAFGNYSNARRLADQIEAIGYTVRISERPTANRTLYVIMVGEYSSREAALSGSDMLEAALGIESFPIAMD